MCNSPAAWLSLPFLPFPFCCLHRYQHLLPALFAIERLKILSATGREEKRFIYSLSAVCCEISFSMLEMCSGAFSKGESTEY